MVSSLLGNEEKCSQMDISPRIKVPCSLNKIIHKVVVFLASHARPP